MSMQNCPYNTYVVPIRYFKMIYRDNTVEPDVLGGVCRDLLADLQLTTPYVNRATYVYWRVEACSKFPDETTSVLVEEIA